MSDDDKVKMIAAQAKGFRLITLLLLQGVADKSPREFIAQVKLIAQQAAEEGA